MQYPLYILDIDDNEELSGVDAVGMVEMPAIEKQWMAFSKSKVKHQFDVVDDSRQLLGGAFMIPDLPIPRSDEKGNLYYVSFPAKVIAKIVEKIKSNNTKLSFNFNHNPKEGVDAFVYNDFIIDSKLGILTPSWHSTLPDGTWFGYVKVKDKEAFEFAKAHLTGFSIEGMFSEIKLKDDEDIIIEKLRELIKN